jgi:hypothetical protein
MGCESAGFPCKPKRFETILNDPEEFFCPAPFTDRTPYRMRAFRVIHGHRPNRNGKRPEGNGLERIRNLREIFFRNLPEKFQGYMNEGRFNEVQAR